MLTNCLLNALGVNVCVVFECYGVVVLLCARPCIVFQ